MKSSVPPDDGLWITFEGGEGSGKGTQLRLLQQAILSHGRDPVMTRDPGTTKGAEEIRSLLVTGEPNRWHSKSEVLLYLAARADLYERVILPALNTGRVVITDRFADSTMVYQSFVKGFPVDDLRTLHRVLFGPRLPDITFILDIDPEVGLERTRGRATMNAAGDTEDRFEREGLDFHRKVRDGYLRVAAADPTRCVVIPADGTPEEVHERIMQVLRTWWYCELFNPL